MAEKRTGILRARFVGKDGSMGFVNGGVYSVYSYGTSGLFGKNRFIWIHVVGSVLKCPYSNLQTLFENWEFIDERK